MSRQISSDDIVIAFLLNPQFDEYSIPFRPREHVASVAVRWFRLHMGDKLVQAVQEFNDFSGRRGFFAREKEIWQLRSNILTFWEFARYGAPVISELAVRLARTPSNTVPAERSFSNLKVIHNSIRNRLSHDRVNKLLYVYMNTRVLERIEGKSSEQEPVAEETLVDLENEVVALGVVDNINYEIASEAAGEAPDEDFGAQTSLEDHTHLEETAARALASEIALI